MSINHLHRMTSVEIYKEYKALLKTNAELKAIAKVTEEIIATLSKDDQQKLNRWILTMRTIRSQPFY